MISGILSAVGLRDFCAREQIAELVGRVARHPNTAREARSTDGGHEAELGKLRTLLIFSAPRQQTWLVADQRSLYVVLDDRQWEEAQVKASVALQLAQPVTVAPDDAAANGRLRIGSMSGDLQFSKILFQRVDVREMLEAFIGESTA